MRRLGPVSRPTRFRVVGLLIIVGLLVEAWSIFQVNAWGFMVFAGGALSLLGLGVVLNVYWVSLELSMSTDTTNDTPPLQDADQPELATWKSTEGDAISR
jgi:hypothetical protein